MYEIKLADWKLESGGNVWNGKETLEIENFGNRNHENMKILETWTLKVWKPISRSIQDMHYFQL